MDLSENCKLYCHWNKQFKIIILSKYYSFHKIFYLILRRLFCTEEIRNPFKFTSVYESNKETEDELLEEEDM